MSGSFKTPAILPRPFGVAKLIDASCRVMGDPVPSLRGDERSKEKKRYHGWRLIYDGWLSDGAVAIKIPVTQQARVEEMLSKRITKFGLDASKAYRPIMGDVLLSSPVSTLRSDWDGEYVLLQSNDPLRGVGLTKRSQIAGIKFADMQNSCWFDAHYLRAVWNWWPKADIVPACNPLGRVSSSVPLAFHDVDAGWIGMLMQVVVTK